MGTRRRALRAAGTLVLLSSTACGDRKCEETKAASPAPSASASASASAKRTPLDDVEEAEVRALCALAALPTPPEHTGNSDWDTAVIATKKSDRRFGWVKMTGIASKMKPDDVAFYLMGLDVGRANADVAFGMCGRFREDRERKVLITVTYRTSGDARKGDYLTYVALGMGHSNPDGIRTRVKDVSEHEAKVAVLKQARELVGEHDLVHRSGVIDPWKEALEAR